MNSTTKKRGRPTAVYRAADGTRYEGLSRRANGRWRITGSGEEFREPDERLAIAKFRQWQQQQQGAAPFRVDIARAPNTATAVADAMAVHRAATAPGVQRITMQGDDLIFSTDFPAEMEDALWSRVRQEIITRPKWVAERTGIEEIGYLDKIKPSRPSATLEALGKLHADKPGLSANERTRSKTYWGEFTAAVGVTTADDIDHDRVIMFEKWLNQQNLSPKSQKHRISMVRRVLGYALKRGEKVRDALDAAALLAAKESMPLNPSPIEPDAFWAIRDAAGKAGDTQFQVLMLTALNLCLHPSEAAAIRWTDLDLDRGEFSSRRRKTKVVRIGVLWPETIAGLRGLTNDHDNVFRSIRSALNSNMICASWRTYRSAAGLPESVKFDSIRDAAFTIACRDTSFDTARLLAGHRAGMADHYVARRPQMVAAACTAVAKAFSVSKHAK